MELFSAGAAKPKNPPPPVIPKGGGGRGGRGELPTPGDPTYDDPINVVPHINGTSGGVIPGNHYEIPDDARQSHSRTPKFDDTIYAMRQDVGLEEDGGETDGATRNMGKPLLLGIIIIIHVVPSPPHTHTCGPYTDDLHVV